MGSISEPEKKPTPVFFFSHGSTMMLGEESDPARVWNEVGTEVLRRGIKRIVMMGAHWETVGDGIEVATKPNPGKHPVGGVKEARYVPYKLNSDVEGGKRVVKMLRAAGFNARENENFDWIHDTFLIIIRMFPHHLPPPTVLISMNARYEPHYHTKLGLTLRPLRSEDTLIIGTGGAVHNLYRNHWTAMLLHKDNFAQHYAPGDWALAFRQAVEDAVTKNTGPDLRRAITRLMKHPMYREAHGTDDHFMALLFVAGAAGGEADVGPNLKTAECWELVNMCNTQYQLGNWD